MPPIILATFNVGLAIRRHSVFLHLSATSGLGCPSRFAGGQRTVGFMPVISARSLAPQAPGLGLSRGLD